MWIANSPPQPANDRKDAPVTARSPAPAPTETRRDGVATGGVATGGDELERHDTIPAPPWLDDGSEPGEPA